MARVGEAPPTRTLPYSPHRLGAELWSDGGPNFPPFPSARRYAARDAFAAGASCVAAQQQFNVFGGNQETLELCQRMGLASLCRSPLAMGLLTGKYRPGERLGVDDVRVATPYWDYFKPGSMEAWLEQLAAIREVLTAGGRSLAQGALAWLWARSAVTIPIPGFRTVVQAEENAHAMAFGPLSDQQVREVDALLHQQART